MNYERGSMQLCGKMTVEYNETLLELLQAKQKGVIGIAGSKHGGKTTVLLDLVDTARTLLKRPCYVKFYHGEYQDLFSELPLVENLQHLEKIKDAIIFVDEFNELFDLTDRKKTALIKRNIAQIEHNNCLLVLCGLPEYFNQLISSYVGSDWLVKSITYDETVNGSALKKYVMGLSGDYVGGMGLNIPVDKVYWKGRFYHVRYNPEWDKKATRVDLFERKEEFSDKNDK